MTQQTGTVDTAVKIKDLEEENELLLLQLHQVQEELEVYFHKYKELESGALTNTSANFVQGWVDDELPEALAEIERLKTLAQVQAEIKEIESRNALNVKLGNMLLESSSSVGGISKIPFSLLGFWRNATSKKIPAELGGKEFAGVIKAYEERGFVGVRSILKNLDLSPIVKANAYTALARHLTNRDAKAAAVAANKAFEIDPKSYRLKWLACRVHEAGDAGRAEAMLDLLPSDVKFSFSESNQARQIRYEAKHLRIRDAKQATQIVSKQQKVQAELDELTNRTSMLTDQKHQTDQQLIKLIEQVETLQKERDTVVVEKARLHQEKLSVSEDSRLLLIQLQQAQEELESVFSERQIKEHESYILLATRNKEIQTLADQLHDLKAQSATALENLSQTLETTTNAERIVSALLEQVQAENLELSQSRDEALVQTVVLQDQLAELSQAKAGLEERKAVLEQEKIALEQECAELVQAREAQAGLEQERQARIEALMAENKRLSEAESASARIIEELNDQCADMYLKIEKMQSVFSKNKELEIRNEKAIRDLEKISAQFEVLKMI